MTDVMLRVLGLLGFCSRLLSANLLEEVMVVSGWVWGLWDYD